jgi:hypothetical protein
MQIFGLVTAKNELFSNSVVKSGIAEAESGKLCIPQKKWNSASFISPFLAETECKFQNFDGIF